MVTDDYDFHEKETLFTLGQQRAISATLNTLLFRTHLPALHQQAKHVQQGSSRSSVGAAAQPSGRHYKSKGMQYSMLEEHAPVLLRCVTELVEPDWPPALSSFQCSVLTWNLPQICLKRGPAMPPGLHVLTCVLLYKLGQRNPCSL